MLIRGAPMWCRWHGCDGMTSRFGKIMEYLVVCAMMAVLAGTQMAAAAESVSEPVQLGEIVISGDKVRSFMDAYPQDVVGMDAAEIKKRNFLTTMEALSTLPGVDVKQSPGSLGARISIRGGGGSGPVKVMIDGRPVNTSQYGGVDLAGIPIDMVKSVIVFKPPVPVWLGPGSSAGVVYIETKKHDQKIDAHMVNRIRVTGGSYGLGTVSGSSKIDTANSGLLLGADYKHKDGKRENSFRDSGSMNANWDRRTGQGTQFQVNGKYYCSRHGSSGPTYNPTPDAEQDYEKASLDLRLKGLLGTRFDYSAKLYGDLLNLEDRANDGSLSTLDLSTAGLTFDTTRSSEHDPHGFKLGGTVEQTRVDHTRMGKHHRDRLSLHGEHSLSLKRFTLTTGVGGEHSNDFGAFPAANLSLRYRLRADTHIKTNVGYSVNLPSFGQLYQPTHGSSDQVEGNPYLDEERILSASMGVEHRKGKARSMAVSVFRTDTWDLIQYLRDEVDLISRPFNYSRAVKQGVDISFMFRIAEAVTVDFSYVFQDTENKETSGELAYAPKHQGKVSIKAVTPFKMRLELLARAYSHQFSDTKNLEAESISGYATVDAKAILPVAVVGKNTEWFVHLSNLLDRRFESHYGYPDDGFRFQGGMSVTF